MILTKGGLQLGTITWGELSTFSDVHNYDDNRFDDVQFSDWEISDFIRIKKKKTKRISPYLENELWEKEDVLTIIKYESYKRNKAILALLWDLDFEQNDNGKAIKVPNKLQCLKCGEIVTIYHPSSLS